MLLVILIIIGILIIIFAANKSKAKAKDNNKSGNLEIENYDTDLYETIPIILKGYEFRPEDNRKAIFGLYIGEYVILEKEPSNKYDPFAVKVLTENGIFIGYVNRDESMNVTMKYERLNYCKVKEIDADVRNRKINFVGIVAYFFKNDLINDTSYNREALKKITDDRFKDTLLFTNCEYTNKKVAITGLFSKHIRTEVEDFFEKRGAKVSSYVGENTDIIVIGMDVNSEKMEKITEIKNKKDGIIIINDEKLNEIMEKE